MLRIHIITLLPELAKGIFSSPPFTWAKKDALNVFIHNLRDFAIDRHGTVDGKPFGGGDGMVLRPEPLKMALDSISGESRKVIVPSPKGQLWSRNRAKDFSQYSGDLIFICGRFAGIDQRFLDKYVDEEFSVGDYIVSGGELPAALMCDSIVRFIPGVLGNLDSFTNDSFESIFEGGLEPPQFTRPRIFEGKVVPSTLVEGNHKKIEKWKREMSLAETKQKRQDLLKF